MVSMQILFPACVDILAEAREPIHYAELTHRALHLLGIDATPLEFLRLKEDVREKLLLQRALGTAYTGEPYFAGMLQRWFETNQLPLLNIEWEGLRIRGNATAGYLAAFELIKRRPYMLTKIIESDNRDKGAAFGMVIEEHVSLWARDQWPMFWRPPENSGKYESPCDHDFRLRLPQQMVHVDVMGPKGRGDNGLIYEITTKHPTDIHLCASIQKQDVMLHGFMAKKRLRDTWEAHDTLPISWFVVWLNCERLGVSYLDLRKRTLYGFMSRKALP